jgi:hypothetical protein
MKRNLILWSVLTVFGLTASLAWAGAGAVMHVNVPFDFYLEDQLLPAGAYQFQMASGLDATGSLVTVRSADGNGIRIVATMPGINANTAASQLRFNQYGGKCFLSSIAIQAHKANLKMLRLEKELRSQIEKAPVVTVIAQR